VWSVRVSVCVCVCVLDALVSPAKIAEPIEIPFGGLTGVDPRKHALDEVSDLFRFKNSFPAMRPFVKIL